MTITLFLFVLLIVCIVIVTTPPWFSCALFLVTACLVAWRFFKRRRFKSRLEDRQVSPEEMANILSLYKGSKLFGRDNDPVNSFHPAEVAYALKHGHFVPLVKIDETIDMNAVACHEVGHTIAARECGELVSEVSVSTNGNGHNILFHDPTRTTSIIEDRFNQAVIRYAGMLAEPPTTNNVRGHVADFEQANALILSLSATTGKPFQEIADNVRDVAVEILEKNSEAREKLVTYLMDKSDLRINNISISPREIFEIIGPQVGQVVFDENLIARYEAP